MKREKIERLLPAVVHRTLRPGSPLAAVLDVMEAIHVPAEEILATLEQRFDPYRAPQSFVPFLGRWVDLDRLFEAGAAAAQGGTPEAIDLGRLRELVAAAAYLSRWRGTRRGLQLFLETATGETGFEIAERVPGSDGEPRPFHLQVRAPAAARPRRALIERIVELEKPAYVTWELEFEEKKGRQTKKKRPVRPQED